MATPEEKKAEAEAKRLAEEKELAELQSESDRIAKEKAEKDAARKAAREATEGTKESEKMYSRSEVMALIKSEMAKLKSGNDDTDIDDVDPYAQKKIRIPRFMGRFIYGFKNTNTDEYFPELVVHAFDVWNEIQNRNEAYVTIVFEPSDDPKDPETMNIPLYTVLTKSQKVWVDLVEVVETDTSYSAGRTERAEIKDWSRVGSGQFVKMKVTQKDYKFKIRFPNDKEVIVGKEVVNW